MTLRPLKPLLHLLRVRSSHCEYADGVAYRRLIALTSLSMAISEGSVDNVAGSMVSQIYVMDDHDGTIPRDVEFIKIPFLLVFLPALSGQIFVA